MYRAPLRALGGVENAAGLWAGISEVGSFLDKESAQHNTADVPVLVREWSKQLNAPRGHYEKNKQQQRRQQQQLLLCWKTMPHTGPPKPT